MASSVLLILILLALSTVVITRKTAGNKTPLGKSRAQIKQRKNALSGSKDTLPIDEKLLRMQDLMEQAKRRMERKAVKKITDERKKEERRGKKLLDSESESTIEKAIEIVNVVEEPTIEIDVKSRLSGKSSGKRLLKVLRKRDSS